jgi:hypothetical protein
MPNSFENRPASPEVGLEQGMAEASLLFTMSDDLVGRLSEDQEAITDTRHRDATVRAGDTLKADLALPDMA